MATATFEELEMNSFFALAYVSRLDRIRRGISRARLLRNLRLISDVYGILVQELRRIDLDSLTDEDVDQLAIDLTRLYSKTSNAIDAIEKKYSTKVAEKIRGDNEIIGDIVEGLCLSRNKDFRDILTKNIRDFAARPSSSDWRTSLAKMQH